MKRFLGPAALAIGMLLAAGGLATAQDEVETRSSSTTWLGDTGLWFVPTAEILPAGKVSVSGYRANFDREQGQTDIAHFVGTFGVGVADRVEIFGSVRADTRIRRDSRPLFDASDPVIGGVLQDYPTLTDFWNGDDYGDIVFGGKINLLSEHRQQPAAVAALSARTCGGTPPCSPLPPKHRPHPAHPEPARRTARGSPCRRR